MALELTDIKFFKSKTVTDTPENGGRMDETKEIVSGQKYNLFPRVSYTERINGYTRYRKEFMANRNADNEIAYGALFCIIKPSNGGDRFYIRPGTQDDTQADLSTDGWIGCGKLYTNVSAGATQIQVEFEADDYTIPNDVTLCIKDDTNLAWVKTANNQYTAEGLFIGDGIATSFSGSLQHIPIIPTTLVIHYTIGGTNYTATTDKSGNITGDHISSGSVEAETGNWNLSFDTPPDDTTNVTADYTERCYTWSGNIATINLYDQVPNNYLADNTYVGVCLELGDLAPAKENVQVTSPAGIFDGNYLSVNNVGTVYDTWTITFTSATSFTCSGANEGSQANGSIDNVYGPINPNTGQPYFFIETAAWGGSWAAGDTVVFTTVPAARAIWWKEVIPAGTVREPQNEVVAEWFVE